MTTTIIRESKSITKQVMSAQNALPIFPQSKWPYQAKINSTIYKAGFCDLVSCYVFISNTPRIVDEFIKTFAKHSYVDKVEMSIGQYNEIVNYGYESPDFMLKKISIRGNLYVVTCKHAKLMFTAYNNGIMLHGINVNSEYRNKGIGTQIINDLYNISDEMNLELYLQPYPDDNFEGGAVEEKQLIERLQKYYTRLGFGPTTNNSMIWSNME
jgi:GNAT superfamily N-acetyltransferase